MAQQVQQVDAVIASRHYFHKALPHYVAGTYTMQEH